LLASSAGSVRGMVNCRHVDRSRHRMHGINKMLCASRKSLRSRVQRSTSRCLLLRPGSRAQLPRVTPADSSGRIASVLGALPHPAPVGRENQSVGVSYSPRDHRASFPKSNAVAVSTTRCGRDTKGRREGVSVGSCSPYATLTSSCACDLHRRDGWIHLADLLGRWES
jgi:hypothetical protein